jgi:thiol-disulfide isomerase/thioredoxin
MPSRRQALALLAFSALALSAAAHASDQKPFDAKAFEAAQAAGKSILVEVHAPWCPVCKAQAPILARLSGDAKYKDVVRFTIDFDSQKDLLRKFGVQKQSTLIAFKGRQETGRSTGDTNPASLESLLAKAI